MQWVDLGQDWSAELICIDNCIDIYLYRHSMMQYLLDKILDWIDPEKTELNIYTDDIPNVGF